MRRLIAIFAVLALAVSAPRVLSAQDSSDVQQDRKEVRHDRREVRGDRREVRHDTRDIRQDRRDVRQDVKAGDTTDARRDARDLRRDRRDRRHAVPRERARATQPHTVCPKTPPLLANMESSEMIVARWAEGMCALRYAWFTGMAIPMATPYNRYSDTTTKKFVRRPHATASTAWAPADTISSPVRVRTTRESGATRALPTMRLKPTRALITPSTHTRSRPRRSRK